MAKRDEATLDDLLTQAKITNRLLAARLKDSMKQIEIVELLADSGASHADIAAVLATTPGVVSTTIGRLRKKAEVAKKNSA